MSASPMQPPTGGGVELPRAATASARRDAADFARAVDRILLLHRDGDPFDPDDLGEACACGHDFRQWRRHTVELIVAARKKADEYRPPRTFTEVITSHAPYNNPAQGLVIQCPECIDGLGGGIYRSTAEWARHVEIELARAGLKVAKR